MDHLDLPLNAVKTQMRKLNRDPGGSDFTFLWIYGFDVTSDDGSP